MPNLVGIGNSQVPTNAMLGGLAYQDSVGEIDIDKIKAKTSDTAKDIFVYDTSKDSDGGAWRHRTQNTSWYNEGASSIRGARKEFPAVAIIVVETNQVTIYDADDPNCPMWMVFNQSMIQLGAMVGYTGFSIGCCTMVNGILMVGMDASNQGNVAGLRLINFISEHFNWKANITGRHSSRSWPIIDRNGGRSNVNIDSNLIINEVINDVDAIVLPNAQIDTSTGLPTPTIVIGTNGGISVITDSGVVYDLTTNNEADDIAEIAFLSDTRYSFATKADNSRWWVDDIQTADENHNYFYQRTTYDYSQGGSNSVNINPLGRVNGTSRGEDGEAIFRQASGMSRIRYVDRLLNYITTEFNTGWMGGDIIGAFMSDIDTTTASIANRNLITNSTFANTNNWTGASNGVLTAPTGLGPYAGGTALRITNTGGSNGRARSNSFSTNVGQQYGIRVSFTNRSSGGQYRVEVRQSGHDLVPMSGTTTAGVYNFTFTSAGTGTYILELYCLGNDGEWAEFDDVYVYELEQDRSVNQKGLQLYGTITKSAVATGAELVAYSGFDTSNYLFQPHNTDLQVGTGDYSVMLWYKGTSDSTGNREIFVKVTGSSTGFWLLNKEYTNKFVFDTVTDPNIVKENEWYHVAGVRESGTAKLYVNGELVGSASSGDNITDTSEGMIIGQDPNNNGWRTRGSLALLRIAASAQSATQIKKIYDDEKCLYHENAKCTLHGTSDAVTALAYDDKTDVLHVGTSGGRSDFRGLNRINNTTTAVTTAISASNGLVAEQ